MYHGLAERLAEFALSVRHEDVPPIVLAEARRRLIDTVGCAVTAIPEPVPALARRVAARIRGEIGAGLIGGGRSSPDWAAFANGAHIRYLDANDTYISKEPAHPSDNFAAIFAAGEHSGADGREWLTAAVVAYEIQCRLCDAASLRARGWDHVAYLQIASALAAARLLGLDQEQATHAANIAGASSAGLRLTRAGELSMWKGCAAANAARNGVFAAILAREGLTGPGPLFEGEMGFWQQVSGPFLIKKLGGPLADDWLLPRSALKLYPAEYHIQSAIAAAIDLRTDIADPDSIRSIEIATFRAGYEIAGKDPEKWQPRTRETADHSLPYCTAVALVDGEITPRQFTPDRLQDPALLDLLSRTTVVEDPEMTADYPACIPNRVQVTLANGTELECEVAYPPGHANNPLTDAQLSERFRAQADPVLGPDRARALWDRLVRIDQDPRPHEIVRLTG
jgi:2-methylcitrate dehydratase